MEQYVKSLFDRLDDNNKMKLFAIMQGAIDEMHNNGIIAQVDPSGTSKLHDPDPEVRVLEKTALAKAVGKNFIPSATPVPTQNGTLAYLTQVNYDPRFKKSICICIQGGLEGLHISGITKQKLTNYNVVIQNNGNDVSEFVNMITWLNDFYDDIEVKVIANSPTTKESVTNNAKKDSNQPKKKGLFSKLFEKKENDLISGKNHSQDLTNNSTSPNQEKSNLPISNQTDYEKYYLNIVSNLSDQAKSVFDSIIEKAKKEILLNPRLYAQCSDEEINEEKWRSLSKEEQFDCVVEMGNFGVIQQAILCADFVDIIPNCDALAIFFRAQDKSPDKRKQVVDAGDGANKDALIESLDLLKICDPNWECSVY